MRNKFILKLVIIPVLFFICMPTYAEQLTSDPYAAIEYITLQNGIQVFLAPSNKATLTSIRLHVGVGWEAEDEKNIGVSHLLEHVLFRDKQLQDEMSYLQLIREAGGEANGGTNARFTSYFGSIPAAKGPWLFDKITQMILEPNIAEDYVAKEKGTIELERGRPSPIAQTLGLNPLDYIFPKYLAKKSFWESEFGLSFDEPFSLTQEQLSTQKLTANQVKKHYEDYYYPANMRLFVAGKFNKQEILKKIQDKWGSLPQRLGKTLPPEKKAIPRQEPYKRFEISPTSPSVTLGTKISGVSVEEEGIIASYMDFLAHRLMKEIRNIKGQTYTAYATTYTQNGFGFSTVRFQTTKESFDENLTVARNHLKKEASAGELSDTQIQEAIDLYLHKYHLRGQEADNMMSLATNYEDILREVGTFTSPYTSLKNATPDKYRATLRKYFAAGQSYEQIYQPPVFFHYDMPFLMFLSSVLCFMGLRRLLTQKFENDKLKWVRKIQYPPAKVLEGLTLVTGWYLFSYVQYGMNIVFEKYSFLQSHVLISQYAFTALWILAIVGVAQGMLSLLPRKLMVHDQDLLVKSISYFSHKIPLANIESIESKRMLAYPFPLSLWLGKVKYRCYNFNPFFWKNGLLITLKNGKAYYFSVKDADKAKSELMGLVKTIQNLKAETQEDVVIAA